jgi:hypothetical protein
MTSISRRFKRQIVGLALVGGSAATYLLCGKTQWALYATLCVAYTIVIVGMAWANGKWQLYFGSGSNDTARFLQLHCGFVLAAVLLLWLAISLNPSMPEWLVSRGGDRWSWYQVLIIVLMVGIVMLEQWWIEKRPKRGENLPT